jgi:hypothetical protein
MDARSNKGETDASGKKDGRDMLQKRNMFFCPHRAAGVYPQSQRSKG